MFKRLLTRMIVWCCAFTAACAPSLLPLPATEIRPYAVQSEPDLQLVQRWSRQFATGAFTTRAGITIPYRYVRPAVKARVPLVLILHGSGAMGTDNRGQLGPFAAAWAQPGMPPAMIVVPQVAERSADYHTDRNGQFASSPGPSFPALVELIDALRRDASVDPRRVHLVGFSMGASAALQLALARPGQFASIIAFSPVPPERDAAARLVNQPLTLVHGDADTENPFSADSAWVGALRAAGGQPRFIVYQGMGHQVPPDMITAVDWRAALLTHPTDKGPRDAGALAAAPLNQPQ